MSSLTAFRGMILAGGIVATTAVGAIYGAQLKSDREAVKQLETLQTASTEELVSSLESRIEQLQGTRGGLVKKISELDERIKTKEKATMPALPTRPGDRAGP